MELWIRSQNKGRLRLISNLRIYQEEGQTDFNIQDDGCILGTYTTYERALEVLDDIQMCLFHNDIGSSKIAIYEMPEE